MLHDVDWVNVFRHGRCLSKQVIVAVIPFEAGRDGYGRREGNPAGLFLSAYGGLSVNPRVGSMTVGGGRFGEDFLINNSAFRLCPC
jgi:hypothetical protein